MGVAGVSIAEGRAEGIAALLAGGMILDGKALESRVEGRLKLERGEDTPVVS